MQIPFALSLSKYLNSAGGDAGFASLLAVALLVILYFAHARESRTLRGRLSEAHDRIDALEGRLAQLLQLQASRPQQAQVPIPQRTAVVPPPTASVARPMGSAVASLRRSPAAVGGTPAGNGASPVAPHGVGAPALMSATNALPELSRVEAVAPLALSAATAQDTMLVTSDPAAAAGGGAGNGARGPLAAAVPTAVPATAVGRGARRGATAGPPRVQIRPETPSGTVTRRPGQPPRGSLLDESQGRPSRKRRLFAILGAIAVIVVIVFVLTRLTSGGTPSKASSSQKTGSKASTQAGPFHAHDVVVDVLNATSVSGLADDVSRVLGKKGYRAGNITNAAVQTQKSTIVYYFPNEQLAAQHVAKALKLAKTAVHPVAPAVTQSCATTPSAGVGSCPGQVIVSVGSDKSSLATASKSS